MTRFARRGTQKIQKKFHEASSWSELKRVWKMSSKRKGQTDRNQNAVAEESKRRTLLPAENTSSLSPSSLKGHSDHAIKDKRNTTLARKRERRREEKRLKRIKEKEKAQICNFCGSKGHQASDCPCSISNSKFGACSKCGSSDHVASDCKGTRLESAKTVCTHCNQRGHQGDSCRLMSNSFESDRCPICHELGHQMKSCPDNPRSIYPVGGSCSQCGSVEHKSAHCPEKESTNEVKEVKVTAIRFGSRESADAVEDVYNVQNVKKKSIMLKKPKVVVF